MPPPSDQRHNVDPPEEITSEAVRGFLTGAFRFGSVSILAHMIMILPHPFKFSSPSSAPVPSQSPSQPPPKQSPFSKEFIRSRLFYRPLEGFSEWLSPASKIYRGLTPQFKVFLHIGAMTLGGCIWAERRVDEYIKYIRKVKRLEKLQAERAARGLSKQSGSLGIDGMPTRLNSGVRIYSSNIKQRTQLSHVILNVSGL